MFRINPTKMSRSDIKCLQDFFAAWPDKVTFHEGVCYSFAFGKKSVVFSHALVKCVDTPDYEIAGKQFTDDNNVHHYEMIGSLEQKWGKWHFSPVNTPTIVLRFKSQIDVTTMSEEQSRLLGAALLKIYYCKDAELTRYYFSGLTTYLLPGENEADVRIYLDLKHPIIARERTNHPEQIRFEVVGELIGRGTFSSVFRVLMTLIPQTDGSLLRKYSSRVVKEIIDLCTPGTWSGDYPIAKFSRYLHVKKPALSLQGRRVHSYMTARYFDGITLDELINQELNAPVLTMTQRLRLILTLIEELNLQVHQDGIIHRDVKPANIKLISDVDDEYPDVIYLDMGLSTMRDASDLASKVGTPYYVAPEIIAGLEASFASDVYSLGLLISQLLRIREDKEFRLPKTEILSQRLRRLYLDSGELSESQCDEMARIISMMTKTESSERFALRQAFEAFSSVCIARVMNQNIDFDASNFLALQRAALKVSKHENYDETLIALLKLELATFADQAPLINTFVCLLRVQALFGLTTQAEVCEKLGSIITSYCEMRAKYKSVCGEIYSLLNDSFSDSLDDDYRLYLGRLILNTLRRCEVSPASVDHLVVLTRKIDKDVSRLEIECKHLHHVALRGGSTDEIVRPLSGGKPPINMARLFSYRANMDSESTPEAGKAARLRSFFGRK